MIRTMKGALKRVEEQAAKIRDLEDQTKTARQWGTQGWEEVGRLGRIMTYRWEKNDARANCPHEDTEVGKISGNTYCLTCGETLTEVNRHVSREART